MIRSYDEANSKIEKQETYRPDQHAGAAAQSVSCQLAGNRDFPSEQGAIGLKPFVFFPQRF